MFWPGCFLARLLLYRADPKEVLARKDFRATPNRSISKLGSHLVIHWLLGQVTTALFASPEYQPSRNER
jgi:hypothetical protein